MSTSETMWDDDDQFGNPPFPRFSLEQEEVFLKRKSALLEEFLRNGGMEPRAVEDRIQILHERIDLLETDLTSKGKWDSARRYIQHAPRTDFDAINRDEFMAWIEVQSLPARPLPSLNALRTINNVTPHRIRAHQLTSMSHGTHSTTPLHANRGSVRSREESPTGSAVSHKSKRPRTVDNEKSPCLRCKILKKRCDSLEQCSHCPEQSFENESDFWKVLGCYRGSFDALCAVICPPFSRSISRTLPHPDGSTQVITFVLTQSRVSAQKRRRILNLAHTNADFLSLNHACWDDTDSRASMAITASSLDQIEEGHILEQDANVLDDYEACWAILQAVYMDRVYLTPTKYNLFRLIRLGNVLSAADRPSWEIFLQAKRLLRQSVEIYLLERLCGHIAAGRMDSPTPFYSPGGSPTNNLVRIDIKNDMEKFLRDVEVTCAGRGKLTGQTQLACFYALLVFGIAKSILIDAYSVRDIYEDEDTWKVTDAMAINSVYKALVSAFCWASKSDIVLQECGETTANHTNNDTWGTCSLVRHDQWEERGIKGTKEFLLGLGTSSPSDSTYNGFFPQKFNSKKISSPKLKPTVLSRPASSQDDGKPTSPVQISDAHVDTLYLG